MKLTINIILLLIYFQTYSQFEKPKVQTMAIGLFSPIMSNGEQDTLSILIFDNIQIFKKTSHSLTVSMSEKDSEKEIKKENKITNRYFAFDKIKGVGYEVIGDDFQNKKSLDSFLFEHIPQFNNESPINQGNFNYLIDSSKEYDLIELYLNKGGENNKYPDSTILYYNSKFQDVEYGFSIRMNIQKQTKKKLQKLKLVYLLHKSDSKENEFPNEYIVSFELMDLQSKDFDQLLQLAYMAKRFFLNKNSIK